MTNFFIDKLTKSQVLFQVVACVGKGLVGCNFVLPTAQYVSHNTMLIILCSYQPQYIPYYQINPILTLNVPFVG